MISENSRLQAAKILADWLEFGNFPEYKLSKINRDRSFIMEVVHGCIRKYAILKWIADQWVSKPPSHFTYALIYVGIYQLMFMNKVAKYAAINECVKGAKNQPNGLGAAKLVNAVLRRYDRQSDLIDEKLSKQSEELRFSHPLELFDRWKKQYGIKATRKMAEWNNQTPSTIIRVRQHIIEVNSFIDILKKSDIDLKIHKSSDKEVFLVIPRGLDVASIPGYQEGWFNIQDPSTVHAVNLLSPKKDEKVLDACAAPGGKAALIAERMGSQKNLTIMELHNDRISRLKENLKRMNMDTAIIVKGDARKPNKYLKQKMFNAILLDVPCSNSGVLQRRSDARWRIDYGRIDKLVNLQYEILSGCASCLSPGGRLVYSTCSIEYEENEGLLSKWTANNPNFTIIETIKILPWKSKTDGAFVALLHRL